jgi:hypothetical protein
MTASDCIPAPTAKLASQKKPAIPAAVRITPNISAYSCAGDRPSIKHTS